MSGSRKEKNTQNYENSEQTKINHSKSYRLMIALVVPHCILPDHGIRLCAHGFQSLVLS
jgi:hypothetical protein